MVAVVGCCGNLKRRMMEISRPGKGHDFASTSCDQRFFYTPSPAPRKKGRITEYHLLSPPPFFVEDASRHPFENSISNTARPKPASSPRSKFRIKSFVEHETINRRAKRNVKSSGRRTKLTKTLGPTNSQKNTWKADRVKTA